MTNISLLALGKLEVRSTELFTVPADHDRASSFLNPADRHRSLVAAGLLRLAAAEVCATDPRNVELTRHCRTCGTDGDHGRPVVRRGPATGVHLSASHAGEVVVVVASTSSPVGVDVELVEHVSFAGFDEAALTSAERRRVAALPPAQARTERARIWTRKEAALKATGFGLALAPSTVVFHGDRTCAPEKAAGFVVADLPGLPHVYRGAVAADTRAVLGSLITFVTGESSSPDLGVVFAACGG